jgi:hypothetical protein
MSSPSIAARSHGRSSEPVNAVPPGDLVPDFALTVSDGVLWPCSPDTLVGGVEVGGVEVGGVDVGGVVGDGQSVRSAVPSSEK